VTDTKQKLKDIGLSDSVAEEWANEFKRLGINLALDVDPVNALGIQEGGDHYSSMKIQPVEFIHGNNISFLDGCVIKRVCRHRAKNGAEDIRKAIHELNLILELEYGE
jgi:hypothetical protein